MENAAGASKPVKPLPKAVQRIILVVTLALIGAIIYLMRPYSGPCTAADFRKHEDNARCELEGAVEPVDEASKAINALALHNKPLDRFVLADAKGKATVLFVQGELTGPAEGQRVRVRARLIPDRITKVKFLVAEKIEVVR